MGSSDAVNAGGRGNSCYLLESPGAGKLMVDFGPTALVGLRRLGGAVAPALRVLGPPLTESTLSSLFRVTYGELERELSTRMSLQIEELSPGEERAFQGYRIRAFAADHMAPPHQALCLRISDAHGKTIAFSGDTRICPGLLAAADGANWLVADCSRLAPPAGPHATWADWQAVLPVLRARSLLLTHLGADMRQRAPTLLDGLELPLPVRVADDGLVIDV